MKTCTQCGMPKDESEFYDWTQNQGKRPDCKECVKSRQRAYAKNNREKVRTGNRRATKTWRQKNPELSRELIKNWHKKHPEAKKRYQVHRYHLTWGTFLEMLELQDHKCMVCGRPIKTRTQQMIDHDHTCCSTATRSCGKCVRGILCVRCNHVLGMVHDDVLLLKALMLYLRGFREKICK